MEDVNKMENSYMLKSPIGVLKISEENNRITGVDLQRENTDVVVIQRYQQHTDLIYEAYKQLNEYFAGRRREFELPLCFRGTAFQQAVWRELQKIPYGETRSYADIAIGIGNPKAVRAIGQANHRNPIMIIVPCHRVINKNGTLGGFGCGLEVKKFLLDLEK